MIALLILLAAAAIVFAGLLVRTVTLRAQLAEVEALRLQAERDASGYTFLIGRTVVVHTTSDRSVRGVLDKVYCDSYVLASPQWIQGAQPSSLGGELLLPKDQVAMIQAFDASDGER